MRPHEYRPLSWYLVFWPPPVLCRLPVHEGLRGSLIVIKVETIDEEELPDLFDVLVLTLIAGESLICGAKDILRDLRVYILWFWSQLLPRRVVVMAHEVSHIPLQVREPDRHAFIGVVLADSGDHVAQTIATSSSRLVSELIMRGHYCTLLRATTTHATLHRERVLLF